MIGQQIRDRRRLRTVLRTRIILIVSCVASALAHSPAPALAEGGRFYGPLELKSGERQLMKNAGAYEDQFVRRGYR